MKNETLLGIVRESLPVDLPEQEEDVEIQKTAYVLGRGEAVYLYHVSPEGLTTFYVVTYKLGHDESLWGFGYTPEKALEDASFQWRTLDPDHEGPNDPFKLVLNLSQQGE